MDTPDKLIAKRIEELPEYVKQAIAEAGATSKLRGIGERHRLRIDQQAILEREVMLVMLGFDTESSFIRNLVAEAKIPLAESQAIAQDVGNDIFVHIRAAMRRMFEEKRLGASAPPSASAPMPQTAPKPVAPPSARPQAAPTLPAEPVGAPPASPAPAPAPVAPLESVAEALAKPTSAPGKSINLSTPPQKLSGYTIDPYREEI